MWDQVVDFANTNSTAITIALIGALAGALAKTLLDRFLPRLWQLLESLGAWLQALVGGRRADYAFERKYLDWLIARHRFLGQLPSNVAVATGEANQLAELEKVYVALAVTPGGASTEAESQQEQRMVHYASRLRRPTGWRRLIPERFRPDAERPYSNAGRAIEQHPRLVIRGDPGSGKTTLMKYLAVTCARALRNNMREGDNRRLAYERLGWKERPFPIFVSLGRHAQVTSWEKGQGLFQCCADEFARELPGCPPGFFERRIKRGGCLILLDAFDELGSRAAREQMAQHISGLIQQSQNAKNKIVVTTRIVGYEGQLDPRGFAVQTVQKLDEDDIQALVRQRYRAIAVNESRNRSASEAELAQRRAADKADRLLAELGRKERLHELAVNPLLLSLIVLDHSVKLVLPDERHILYRDCVEILAARWREQRHAEGSITSTQDSDLSTSQKITLLEAIALEMQKQRTDPVAGQIPIRRARAQELVAAQLPDLLTTLPDEPAKQRIACEQRAAAWLEGIKVESGIVTEVGLDESGEPVVAFSHLTFQEYLAAVAICKQAELYPLLLGHLLNPVWEEVLRLYLAIAQQATPILKELLERTAADPGAWLVAGDCLTERVSVGEPERLQVMNGLHDLVCTGDEAQRVQVCEILADIGSPQTKPVLVEVAEGDAIWKVRYAAAQALGKTGDPRFDHVEPFTVPIPAGEFIMGSDTSGQPDEQPQHRVTLPEYRIGKYPVTNAEYKQFVDETGQTAPRDWNAGNYPAGKSNHPVTYVSWYDAQAYCQWLSHKTNKPYRLPTEAEWEKAARGTDGREYPWGNEFDEAKCNTSESNLSTTTPVGIYTDGASPFQIYDAAGNVWEWCNSEYRSYPYQAGDGRESAEPAKQSPRGLWRRLVRQNSEEISDPPRVFRGGSWDYGSVGARCAFRFYFDPVDRINSVGFRVAESFPGVGSES